MKIVIAGAGEVGSHLAKMLSVENHSITVIDDNERRLDSLAATADVITVEGDITLFEDLRKADVARSDLFIAVGQDENSNIISAMLAKQLGSRKVVSRIDKDEYLLPGSKEIFINMGIDYMFYPEKEAAEEVIKLLGNTSTTEYVDFSGGKLVLVAFRVEEGSALINKTLLEFRELYSCDQKFRTVAIARGAQTIIPTGDDFIKLSDIIYIISNADAVSEVTEFTGKQQVEINNMMILGGSKVARRIAKQLQNDINIKIVDYNPEKAYKMAEMLDKTLIINDDGRRIEVMEEEGLENMDAFIALTGRAETNILAAMLAKRMGVKKVIAEVENLDYIGLSESVGIDTIINKKLTTASSIFRFTINTDVQAIKCLNGCDAEVLEFIAKPDSIVTKDKLREIDFPKGAIVGGVVRADNSFIAWGDTQINPYDRVVVFAIPSAIAKLGKFFE